MSRKLLFLNLALAAMAIWLGWLLRVRWLEGEAKDRAVFERAARAKALLPPPPLIVPQPVTPAQYIDVAQKMLFSKDRNPNVVIETPPPKPEPPMPALPFYYGQMNIGDPVVLLSVTSSASQKSYHAGDKVGPFQVVKWDLDKITLAWNGKTVERRLSEMVPKEAPAEKQQAATPAPAAVVKTLSNAPASSDDKNPQLGIDMGGGFRACLKGENSPAGTVLSGYRKVISQGLMGQSCFWEKVDK